MKKVHTQDTQLCVTFPGWKCWTNWHSAFTTSKSHISSFILLPGISAYLCKYHSSLGICACQSQPWTHVLCRVLQMLCCWTQTSSGVHRLKDWTQKLNQQIFVFTRSSSGQNLNSSMCEKSVQLMKVTIALHSLSLCSLKTTKKMQMQNMSGSIFTWIHSNC